MKQYVGAILIVGVITGAIIGFVFWDEARTSERLSAETEAVGFVATPAEWYDSGEEENVQGHTLTYAYAVEDQVFPRTMEQITWYDSTVTYKVCYDPSDPSDSRLYASDHQCGS